MSADAPFEVRSRRPEGRLGRSVESLVFARGRIPYARERIAPTGSTVAVFVFGDPIRQTPHGGEGQAFDRGFLVGPHDRPAMNEPLGETHAVVVVTTPVGCEAVFGVPPKALRGRVLELGSVWHRAEELRSAMAPLEPAARLQFLEGAIEEGLRPPAGTARCARAVAMLEADPARPVSDIARALDLSHGHLDREFTRIVGLTPRMLARLLRVRRALAGIDVREPVRWADVAAAGGWYDQAHFNRDFKRHTGVSPRAYVAAQRALYPDEQLDTAAGFVPE